MTFEDFIKLHIQELLGLGRTSAAYDLSNLIMKWEKLND